MDGTEGVRAGETCEWREQARRGDGAGGSRNLRVAGKAGSTGRQTGQKTGAPGTRRGKTEGSGNQEVHPHWVPGHTGTGKGV